jgi:hypothetical protein
MFFINYYFASKNVACSSPVGVCNSTLYNNSNTSNYPILLFKAGPINAIVFFKKASLRS